MIKSIEWKKDNLTIIDQTELPAQLIFKVLNSAEEVYEAIARLRVRGAPAIGVAAAFGLYLDLKNRSFANHEEFRKEAVARAEYLARARPTAVNLRWALQSILKQIEALEENPPELLSEVLKIAQNIMQDDVQRCEKIGTEGAGLIEAGMSVLTHCNTGALATAGIGTALGAILKAHQHGKRIQVYADETRPLLQGARLTMWELQQAGIPATLITDSMAAYAMQQNKIDLVIVGADRIAANGDVANKIGTYSLAVNARYHGIPFYVAAPLSTFDFSIESGKNIPIEERDGGELSRIWNRLSITVDGCHCWNPAFDVTPAELITALITEQGIIEPPFTRTLKKFNPYNKTYQNKKEPIV